MSDAPSISDLLDAFPEDIPSRAILCAALEQRSISQVVMDKSISDPVAGGALIAENRNGTVFVGHGVTQQFLESALTSLCQERRVVLTISDRQDALYDWNWLANRQVFDRYEHTTLDMDVVARLAREVPEGRSIEPIDRELFRRCQWHDEMSSMLGSEDQFLRNALGICQMDSDTIVMEAYAILSDHAGTEIGGITHEAHRRQGNAAVTGACLIDSHLRDHLPIYWCCDQDNEGSARTAQRLGFRDRREYRFIVVAKEEIKD